MKSGFCTANTYIIPDRLPHHKIQICTCYFLLLLSCVVLLSAHSVEAKASELAQHQATCENPAAEGMTRAQACITAAKLAKNPILILSGMQLETVPAAVFELTFLEELHLGSNRLSTIPDSLQKLKKLRGLSLSENKFSVLPKVVFALPTLNWLEVQNNQIEKFQDTKRGEPMPAFESVASINLAFNRLSELPNILFRFKELKNLSLGNNKLTNLSEGVEKLLTLKSLELDHNQLTTIPSAISKLRVLETLWLNDNQISKLPDAMGQLIKLEKLELHNNRLKYLPDCILELRLLEKLTLGGNQISALPAELARLRGLRELSLVSNPFTDSPIPNPFNHFPPVITELTGLEILYFGAPQPIRLPDELSNLAQLSELILLDQAYKNVPEVIYRLPKLSSLRLGSQNNWKQLPAEQREKLLDRDVGWY